MLPFNTRNRDESGDDTKGVSKEKANPLMFDMYGRYADETIRFLKKIAMGLDVRMSKKRCMCSRQNSQEPVGIELRGIATEVSARSSTTISITTAQQEELLPQISSGQRRGGKGSVYPERESLMRSSRFGDGVSEHSHFFSI